MKTKIKFLLFSIITGALCLTACSKDGDTGPIGPQGTQGETGPAGAQGDTGTANVIYSDWITVPNGGWSPTSGSVTRKTATLLAPEITQEHLDTGVILVYSNKVFSSNPESIVLLPMDDDDFEFLVEEIIVGEIILKVRLINLGNFSNGFTPLPFRYVIIPGGIAVKGEAHPNFEKLSYGEVMEYFKIPY